MKLATTQFFRLFKRISTDTLKKTEPCVFSHIVKCWYYQSKDSGRKTLVVEAPIPDHDGFAQATIRYLCHPHVNANARVKTHLCNDKKNALFLFKDVPVLLSSKLAKCQPIHAQASSANSTNNTLADQEKNSLPSNAPPLLTATLAKNLLQKQFVNMYTETDDNSSPIEKSDNNSLGKIPTPFGSKNKTVAIKKQESEMSHPALQQSSAGTSDLLAGLIDENSVSSESNEGEDEESGDVEMDESEESSSSNAENNNNLENKKDAALAAALRQKETPVDFIVYREDMEENKDNQSLNKRLEEARKNEFFAIDPDSEVDALMTPADLAKHAEKKFKFYNNKARRHWKLSDNKNPAMELPRTAAKNLPKGLKVEDPKNPKNDLNTIILGDYDNPFQNGNLTLEQAADIMNAYQSEWSGNLFLPAIQVKRIMRDVLLLLHKLHSTGNGHGNLDASKVVLDEKTNRPVELLDFFFGAGITRKTYEKLAHDRESLGISYVKKPPEALLSWIMDEEREAEEKKANNKIL